MRLNTPRFGEVDVKEEDIIVFPAGILGFEHVQRYVWLEHSDDGVFHILQGVDDPAVAFVLINPLVFRPDYKVEVPPKQWAVLELDRALARDLLVTAFDRYTRHPGEHSQYLD
ncbi:MAG: flagellar assembly protein FliW, partial [Limnochordales bacterium]